MSLRLHRPVFSLLSLLVFAGCSPAQTAPVAKIPAGKTGAALAPVAGANRPDIGVNLEGLADWSRAMMFADAMKTSRAWGKPDQPWVHEVKTDALGWPLEDAGVVVVADTPGISGTYALSFEGQAAVRGHFKTTIENLVYDPATKRSTAQVVVPNGENQLMLSFTGTQNGVKNVRLLRPGSDAQATFSQPFLQKLAPFSTIRFMDFLSTNNNPVQKWEQRTTPAHASQARAQGGALEYVVELANTCDKDVWICVPDGADENYTRQMALLLKRGLEPDRKVYVEWSNEVWNWGFKQATNNLNSAKVEGRQPNSPLAFDKDQNEGYWAMRRIAQKAAETGHVFREVFGDQGFERVRPVFATQVGYEEVYKQGLAFLEARYKQPHAVIYGLAGAPYFQVSDELNRKKDLSVEEIFAAIPANMKENLDRAATMSAYARFYNLKTLAYEGGQHLQDHIDAGNADAKVAANRDPRMGAAMETYLRGWNSLGGDLFVYFTLSSAYNKWGSWGLVEDITQSSPKFDAALRVLNAPRAPLGLGTPVPGEINAGDFSATNRWDKRGAERVPVEPDKWLQYAVRAPKAGLYQLKVRLAPGEAARAQVLVYSKAHALEVAQGSDNATVSLPLEAGLNVLRVVGEQGRFDLKSLQIAAP